MKPTSLKLLLVLSMTLASFNAVFTQVVEPLDSLKAILIQTKDTLRVEVLCKIAKNHFYLSQIDSSEKYTLQAEAYIRQNKIDSPAHLAGIYIQKGNLANQHRQLGESNSFHQQALDIFKSIGNKRGESVALSNIGINYIQMEAYDKALSYLYPSLEISQELNHQDDLYKAYQNIAVVLSCLERNEEAKAIRLKILDYAIKNNNWYGIIYAAGSLASNYKNLGMLDSAFHYEQMAYAKSKEVGNTLYEGRLLRAMSRTAILKQQYLQALQYVEQAFTLADTSNYQDMSFLYNYDAEAKFGLARYKEAFTSAYKSLAYAQIDEETILLNNAYFQLYEFYKKRNQSSEALKYHELYKTMQDTVYNQEKLAKVQNLEIEFQTKQKEAEINKLKQESEIQDLQIRQGKLLLLLVLGAALLLGCVGYFLYRQRLLRKELALMQSEQRLLRTQMNPHFFFHALSSIQQFILKEADKREAVLYLSKFSRLMRSVLEGSRNEAVTLGSEIESISHYVELQQLRYGNVFDFNMHVDEALDVEDWAFPSMLLQPAVENAIEHGLIPKKSKGMLHLYFKLEAEKMKVTVEDNGIGRKETVPGHQSYRKSVALEVMYERIQLMNRQQKQKATFDIIDLQDEDGEASGTKVVFILPLKPAI